MTSFLVCLLTLVSGGVFQTRAQVAKPWTQRVRVIADTVWFEAAHGDSHVRIRYCFAPRTGAWCRLPRRGWNETSNLQIPRERGDSVTLAPGLALVCRPPVDLGACQTFGVHARGDTTLYPLTPHTNAQVLARLRNAAGIETDQPLKITEYVNAWAAADDAVWFGLAGGFPEGEGEYGGLLRFDRATRTVETIVHVRLADATVTGLAVEGGKLWVGTLHPTEYAPVGSTGVLCRDLRTKRWTTLDSAGVWLPDKVIQTLAAHDGMLYIATRDGLAAFDTRTSRWTVRYFHETTIAGSTVYELSDRRPTDRSPAQ